MQHQCQCETTGNPIFEALIIVQWRWRYGGGAHHSLLGADP